MNRLAAASDTRRVRQAHVAFEVPAIAALKSSAYRWLLIFIAAVAFCAGVVAFCAAAVI